MAQAIQNIEATSGAVATGFEKQPQQNVEQKKLERERNSKVREVVAELNKTVESTETKLSFTVDMESKKTVIKVIDTSTGNVIRQIPSEEAMKISQHIKSLMGILYDATV